MSDTAMISRPGAFWEFLARAKPGPSRESGSRSPTSDPGYFAQGEFPPPSPDPLDARRPAPAGTGRRSRPRGPRMTEPHPFDPPPRQH